MPKLKQPKSVRAPILLDAGYIAMIEQANQLGLTHLLFGEYESLSWRAFVQYGKERRRPLGYHEGHPVFAVVLRSRRLCVALNTETRLAVALLRPEAYGLPPLAAPLRVGDPFVPAPLPPACLDKPLGGKIPIPAQVRAGTHR